VLRESERKFRTLAEQSPNMIFINQKGRIVYANKRCEQVMGYTQDEFCADDFNFLTLIEPEHRELIKQSFSKHMSDQEVEPYEYAVITKDGTRVEVILIAKLIDYRGERAILGTVTDVTQYKRMNEALRQSEEKYRTILESMEEGYFEVDLAGNLTFFNDALCRIFGYPEEELIGLNNRDYTTPQTAKRMYKIFNRVYRTGKPASIADYEVITKDGSKVVLELSTSLMRDTLGDPIGFRGAVRDVTERIRSEQDKRRLEAQLQYARRMEALGTLAGGIAHNFNNLLMGIMGNTSLMLLDTDPAHPNYERLSNIQKSVQSGSRLTGQLLGYAREGTHEIKALDINRLVKETSETFGTTKREIRIHREFAEDLHGVMADQAQIEQVFLNLYVNAADAMPGGGELFLETMNMTDAQMKGKSFKIKPGSYVVAKVRDTGIGMDRKTTERIFEPFFTTKGLAKGTGLGLASVYGMVKAHGGYIDVDSEKGQGTTFSIYLPSSGEKVQEIKASPETIQGGKETLLLVDDEQMVLEVNQEMLEMMGYTVLVAKGGKEAIEFYRENRETISLVILDMIMPDMSGRDTYDKLKTMNPEVKVLLSSGYGINGQAAEFLERGCDGFIQKPFDIKEVSHKVREILDKK
jgi:two-component system cell cycle sensor histidine kinase/response regulator CckA